MRNILSVLLLLVTLSAIGQTQPTKPTGALPYGSLWVDVNGDVWSGSGVVGYTNLGKKAVIDSLLNLKVNIEDIANVIRQGDNVSELFNDAEYITLADLPEGGKSSILNLSTTTTLNWQSGMATDETGTPTGETWAERFGNGISMLRLYNDGVSWIDESLQIQVTYTGNNITTVKFPNVIGDTKIIIISSGASGAPTGIFVNRGIWVEETYHRGDYVTAPSTTDPLGTSLYFLIGNDDYVSTITPGSDLGHWSEVPAAKGEKGDQGDPGATGSPGVGVPVGGTAGQILSKVNSTDYNTQWVPEPIFTEVDPTVPAHVKGITSPDISNWDTAFSWGNHATAGYLNSSSAGFGLNYNTTTNKLDWGALTGGIRNITVPTGETLHIGVEGSDDLFAFNSISSNLGSNIGFLRTRSYSSINNLFLGKYDSGIDRGIYQNPIGFDFRYTEDVTSSLDERSLVDKGYVDTQINNLKSAYSNIITVPGGNRTIAVSDRNTYWICTGTPSTITVPTDATIAFPVGERIDIQINVSATANINGASGVTLTHAGGTGDTTREGFVVITLIKTGANTWTIVGGE